MAGTPTGAIPNFAATDARPESLAKAQPFDDKCIVPAAYRPLDRRYLYNHERYLDRPRPELQKAWGADNVCLYAMPGGTGGGPAVWCHGLLPDYHAFRGSYGGYAFPLHDRRGGHGPSNLDGDLLAALGRPMAPP